VILASTLGSYGRRPGNAWRRPVRRTPECPAACRGRGAPSRWSEGGGPRLGA